MAESPPIRVMIVDDHSMLRNGLAILIEGFDDFELAGVAANGAEAVRLCAEVQPDVILMDLVMPEMDGIAATRAIRGAHPEVQIIALTSIGDSASMHVALQAGATRCLVKNASVDELAEAIRLAR